MPVAPARAAAFEILLKIDSGAGHCDELLHSLRVEALSAQDRNLCTTLVMGTLRWQIALDAQLRTYLKRPNEKLDARVQLALRLGAFQLLHLDRIPPHAAISESVELAKSAGNQYAAGMVNAILRKVATAKPVAAPDAFANVAELAAGLAHPEWLVKRWAAEYGMAAAEKICRFDQEQPQTSIRLLATEEEARLLEEGVELGPGSFLATARTVSRGDVTVTDTYREGLVRIQDEGSQLVAELAGRGSAILDCCAAPGGKTAILAERNPDARLVACDVSGRRLENMKRLLLHSSADSSRIEFRVADAAQLSYRDEFDLVVCDVPCSGTGTLARNPEIRHRLTPEGLDRHHRRQSEILRASMKAVRPGGRLLYATCSLEREENDAVVEECLPTASGFRRAPLEEELDALVIEGAVSADAAAGLRRSAFKDGYLRTIPGVHRCDGFFAALLVRDAS
jgi:16S rRNA (cytosine967-C5)-methyltransferase